MINTRAQWKLLLAWITLVIVKQHLAKKIALMDLPSIYHKYSPRLDPRCPNRGSAIRRMWHLQDSNGQVLALAFRVVFLSINLIHSQHSFHVYCPLNPPNTFFSMRQKSSQPFQLYPLCSEAGPGKLGGFARTISPSLGAGTCGGGTFVC